MKSGTPLDYAELHLSPKRSRCKLFVSSNGNIEELATGLVEPFVAHLKVAEEQVASDAQSIKLEVGRRKNSETWFTKGTLERFVRFVSTPEVLELVNTLDDEMSKLEAAQRMYSQGAGDQLSGGGGTGVTAAADATKKELLRAIDIRLDAVRQDLSSARAHATAAGFNVKTVSELQMFAEWFGARCLNESCSRFILLSERRSQIINPWKSGSDDRAVRSSFGSDMSISDEPASSPPTGHIQQREGSFPLRRSFSRESGVEANCANKKDDTGTDNKEESSTSGQVVSIQSARRLSVQDRISLFENKQKENSGSGGKPVAAKSVELRRLSSDVGLSTPPAPVVEKAVLRRWSGSGDMITDLSSQKKDTESPLCTKSEEKKDLPLNDTGSAVNSRTKIATGLGPCSISESGLKDSSFYQSEDTVDSSNSSPNLGSGESDGWKHGKTQSRSFIGRPKDQENSEEKFRCSPGGKSEEVIGFREQVKLKGSQSGEELDGVIGEVVSQRHVSGVNNQGASRTQIWSVGSKGGGQVEIPNQGEDFESRNHSATRSLLQAPHKTLTDSGRIESGAGSKIREAFAAHYKGIEGESMGGRREIEKKELASSKKVSGSSVSRVGDSGAQGMKFHRQVTAPEQIKKTDSLREMSSGYGNSRTPLSGKLMTQAQEDFNSFVTPPPDQVQQVRQSKGSQELKDLKMKATELEKLFAEHKLRGTGDELSTSLRGKSADTQGESAASLSCPTPIADIALSQLSDSYPSTESARSSKNKTEFSAAPLVGTVDTQNYIDGLNKNFTELSVSEVSHGKFYDRYTQKRDAKLRDEWCSNGVEKEAKLKAMKDSLEQSRAEMKAKLSESAHRHDSVSSARRRAERLRSFNTRSITRDQQHLDFGNSEGEENALEFLEQKRVRDDRVSDATSFKDGGSRSVQEKNLLPTKSLSYSPPSHSAAPAPRSSTKVSGINTGRRRMQPENALVQSPPNFSDLRKENTKPSGGTSKMIRPQERNSSLSKNTSEEALIIEEKSLQSHLQRKSYANPRDFRDMSPLDSDGVVLAPLKFDKEVLSNVQTRPFLKKGSRTGFASRASILKKKPSILSKPIIDEENDDLTSGQDNFVNMVKDKGGEGFETMNLEGNSNLDNGEERMSLESERLFNSGSETGDCMRSISQVEQALGAELPPIMPSSFHPVKSIQDWPGESPMSWNSSTQNPFSYSNAMSDVDASMNSPIGSPASWNSHSLSQVDTDAAPMRKKWGTSQKPTLVAHSSNNSPRKDMTRGFKRLLKFGWKNRGSESLVDWISVTTSEGDNDTEDGRDPANWPSEDLRKSRMRFSQAQPSDDSFNESEFSNEWVQSSHNSIPAPPTNFKLEDQMSGSSNKAPRSFFSLPPFRNKGSDTKPR
ncbi:COP1-interacting protein-related [Forsythia ovata]|uniref:COP1-interacting protein-related n=1 Tax=Forsythia ovata TaxID=205694 RepID=A0ABD1TUS9_9LAMI